MSRVGLATIFVVMNLYADLEEAHELFNTASCMECHNEEDFTPQKRAKAENFIDIENRVMACQLANDDQWFDDEVHDVARYLNKEYYKFKE